MDPVSRIENRQHIAFILINNYSMIAFSAAVEPLRLANRLSQKKVYTWTCYSADGKPVRASNGIQTAVDGSIVALDDASMVFVVSGIRVQAEQAGELMPRRLRYLASRGVPVGAVCTASHLLARMGLLDGYRCTIHWENRKSFQEEFPHIDVSAELFEIDRNRFTCAGGTAALDMMLHFISEQHGYRLAAAIAEMTIHHAIRLGNEAQRTNLPARLGITHSKLIDVIRLMEANLEQPFSCTELAEQVRLSPRQLERLFQKYLSCTPTRYYLKLRLEQARTLLRQTSQPVLQVAISCGFVSASHFTKCYREQFRRTPSKERQVLI